MAPRKTTTASGEEPAPRRSSRISSQPSAETPAKETKPKSAAKTKPAKRSVDEDGNSAAKSSKKAKTSDTEEAEAPAKLSKIDLGDSLPSFTLKNEKDEDVDVSTLTAEKGVVFFLVPKADTPGCTNQACGFRDIYPDFTSVDYEVYCLSADKPAAQARWQTKKSLPYPLLSDPNRVLITALGAGAGGKTQRSHFIFEKGGKLVDKKIPVKPADSPKLALEFIKGLDDE